MGERGVKLSGGQRQRIGIARALYKKASVLVLDEATNALDAETELEVLEAIQRLPNQVTTFMVTHRMTALSSCDQVIRITEGTIGEYPGQNQEDSISEPGSNLKNSMINSGQELLQTA